ncbi:Putative conjugal transfer protein [Desulfonema limicola]|uniref:Conjugal transfer protein n=2 Tax=Desulfonema limicola TaxID=45656 RepID=A0A975GES0_9BACT|nr:Putative conjugal transfer protein [Desulfonema limicola]
MHLYSRYAFRGLYYGNSAFAACEESNMPSLSDMMGAMNWECMFPVRIAGTRIDPYRDETDNIDQSNMDFNTIVNASGSNPNDSDSSDVFCKCESAGVVTETPIGITVSFWEPTRVIEVVKDSFCFPLLGSDLSGEITGSDADSMRQSKDGTVQVVKPGVQQSFWQAHYYVFPIMAILEVLTDFICMDFSAFDLGYMTEVDPRWDDSELSALLTPETVLFANPVAQLACIPDVMAATVKYTINTLYWCQGAWAKVFPLTGFVTHTGTPVQSQAAILGRTIYNLHRSFVLWGTVGTEAMCHRVPMPIWKKGQYKWQLLWPKRDTKCRVIGEPGFKWSSNKNPPFPDKNPDNFVNLLWRKRDCCAR